MAYKKTGNSTRVRIEDWATPDSLIILQGLARDGMTMGDIATKRIGISKTTLYEWIKINSDIANALKKGKEVIDCEVENALLKRALGYYEVETIDGKVVKKSIPPDITAQIFWLKNRKSDKWRDKHENTVDFNSGDVEINIKAIKEEK